MLIKSKSKPTIKPRALRLGDRVGLVCPGSRPASPAVVERCKRLVCELGFEPVVGQHVLDVHGFMAGTDEARLKDLEQFIHDESVGAIFCITGGYGSLHLLPHLDYDRMAQSGKLILGSDDNTIFLNAIQARTGLITLHGPNLDAVRTRATFDKLKEAVMATSVLPAVSAFDPFGDSIVSGADFFCSAEGTGEGRLIGGNLTAFASLLGTEYEPEPRGSIIFLEDINEQNGILDRWFTSLYLAGFLQYASAVVCGSFENCTGRESTNMLSVVDTFADRLSYLNKTSCFGMPFGQRADTSVIPIGVNARLKASEGILEFLEPALV